MPDSYREATARTRIRLLLDAGSFVEFVGPAQRVTSPHLKALDLPAAFDDGIVVGSGHIAGHSVLIAAQEGGFMGGSIGEVHGAKLTGLFERARDQRPAAVLVLADCGGVRLQEANAALLGVSEIMRALLSARAMGVPVFALIGGQAGCFGGMGIIARLCDAIILSEEGRLGLSGPEVIETACGVEEFDSRDRALVWRTFGGKHRHAMGDAAALVADEIGAFRAATVDLLGKVKPRLDLQPVESELARLAERLELQAWHGDPGRREIGTVCPTNLQSLLSQLFPLGHDIRVRSALFAGMARTAVGNVYAIGTVDAVPIGVELAHELSAVILSVVRTDPGRTIMLAVDTTGQRLSRHDELLGIDAYLALIGKCLDLARRRGHRIVGLVRSEAVSGGFLVTNLLADMCYALPEAEIRVMNLPAMSRIARIPLEQLQALSRTSPVFAPAAEYYRRMGGIEAIWAGNLAECLVAALGGPPSGDTRRSLGTARGGRVAAEEVSARVRHHGA